MDPQPLPLLKEWQSRLREARLVHYEAAKYYSRYNQWLGIPVVVLSTFVGTSVFAALGQSIDIRVQIVVGLCSVAAAMLAGVQTFFRFAERAEKHRAVAVQYAALNREIEELLAFGGEASREYISALRKRIDDLGKDAPSTPNWLWERAKKQAAAGDQPPPTGSGGVS